MGLILTNFGTVPTSTRKTFHLKSAFTRDYTKNVLNRFSTVQILQKYQQYAGKTG